MNNSAKIYVAGHRGLLGSAVVRNLTKQGYSNLLLRTSQELDLIRQESTFNFFEKERPEYVFLCAARVGGIGANMKFSGEFLYQNLQIQNNVMEGARRVGVKKLLFVGSSCIYPKQAEVPIKESALLTGPLEITNEGYALAKIAGIKMCELYRKQYGCDFISAQPTNLFGINDQYHPEYSHLLPSLIRKVHEAKKTGSGFIEIWGSGKPRREFLLSDECADALVFLMQNYSDPSPVNVGTGKDETVLALAQTVAEAIGVKLEFRLDPSKPDGTMRKVLDVSRLKELGWVSKIGLLSGIRIAYEDFLKKEQA
jgi:GDP-L-fucose synthase